MRNKLHQRNPQTEPVFFTGSHFSLSFISILFFVFAVPARISLTPSMDYPNTPPGKALRPSNRILPSNKKPKLRLFQSDEKITENECGFLRYFLRKGLLSAICVHTIRSKVLRDVTPCIKDSMTPEIFSVRRGQKR